MFSAFSNPNAVRRMLDNKFSVFVHVHGKNRGVCIVIINITIGLLRNREIGYILISSGFKTRNFFGLRVLRTKF